MAKQSYRSPQAVLVVVAVVVMGYVITHARAATLVGDINNDGTVNVFDMSILLSKWGTATTSADLNNDGTVNVFDLSALLSHWGQTAPSSTPTPTAAATPTPTLTGLSCTNPVYSATWPQTQFAGWDGPNASVSNDVQSDGTGPSTDSEQMNVCSTSNWNVVANWTDRGGSINAYPDTNFTLTGDKTVSQYNSMQTCFGNIDPIPSGPQWPSAGGSEWDYAYDVWINNHTGENVWANDIEIMVWNDYTDTSIMPPAGSRAVTIDGVAYHMFKGGGANEWIYTRDNKVTSGCFDMLKIMKDMTNNSAATTIFTDTGGRVQLSSSGLTNNGAPQHLEYGVEISGTHGTQTFQITNATLTVQ